MDGSPSHPQGNYAHAPPQKRYSKVASGSIKIISFAHACWIVYIKQDCQPAETWNHFAENFKPLACNFGLLNGHSSHVAAWMREISNQPGRYGVNRWYKNNRNSSSHLLQYDSSASIGDN
jgi:hypothetical protein